MRTAAAVLALLLALLFCAGAARAGKREKLPYPTVHRYDGPRGRPQLALGVVSDVQYADRDEEERRHFRLSPGKVAQCVAELNANRSHLDLVVHLGDLVDSDMARNGPPMLALLAKLRFPLYHVLGNHDYLGTPEDRLDSVHEALGMPRRYYSIAAGKGNRYRLIVLDGNDLSTYATARDSPRRAAADAMLRTLSRLGAKNGKTFNGGVGDEQLAWLRRQLGEACAARQRAVVLIHQGLRPKGERTNLWNDRAVVDAVTSFHCLVAVFNGHAHKFLYDFQYTRHRQVHFVTFGGIVQSPFTSFAFADFYDDELHVHGLVFGRQIEYHLSLAMHAKPPADGDADDNTTSQLQHRVSTPTLISPVIGPTLDGASLVTRAALSSVAPGDEDAASSAVIVEFALVAAAAIAVAGWLLRRRR